MQNRFEAKKQRILELLETPDADYQDLSPKGSIDEAIRPLITNINSLPGLVTTSSCSGRVSVFCEGRKRIGEEAESQADVEVVRTGPGGKGQGSWLYISHDPVKVAEDTDFMSLFGLQRPEGKDRQFAVPPSTFIHLKFEPMILHILTASISDSNRVLAAALSAGFRESGAVSLSTPRGNNVNELNPMVAIRSTGYSFDSIIGYQNKEGVNISLVDDTYLGVLVSLANSRFQINEERISRLRQALLAQYEVAPKSTKKPYWEDPEARRRRKREEGLARQQQLAAESSTVRQAASSEEAYDHAYDTL